jgi:hypothetical protein
LTKSRLLHHYSIYIHDKQCEHALSSEIIRHFNKSICVFLIGTYWRYAKQNNYPLKHTHKHTHTHTHTLVSLTSRHPIHQRGLNSQGRWKRGGTALLLGWCNGPEMAV